MVCLYYKYLLLFRKDEVSCIPDHSRILHISNIFTFSASFCSNFIMDFQMSSPTTNTKDNWVGPGIYRLTSATHEGKYLSVDDQDKLVVARFVCIIIWLNVNAKLIFIYLVIKAIRLTSNSNGRFLMPAKGISKMIQRWLLSPNSSS